MDNAYAKQRYLLLKALNEAAAPLPPGELEVHLRLLSEKEFGSNELADRPRKFGRLLRSSLEVHEVQPTWNGFEITNDGQAMLSALDRYVRTSEEHELPYFALD